MQERVREEKVSSLSIAQARERFRGKWILGLITGDNSIDDLTRVKVLAASGSRSRISKALKRERKDGRRSPGERYYIFHTKPMSGLKGKIVRAFLGCNLSR